MTSSMTIAFCKRRIIHRRRCRSSPATRYGIYRLFSESPVLQGGDVESGCTVLYCLCRNDNQVLALEHQVCAIHKGRRGPDRPSSEPCSNGASSRNTEGLSESGRNLLPSGRGGLSKP